MFTVIDGGGMTLGFKNRVEISQFTEGCTVITMDNTTKDLSEEKNSRMPVVRKQSGAKVKQAKSNALVVYEGKEAAPEKKDSSET